MNKKTIIFILILIQSIIYLYPYPGLQTKKEEYMLKALFINKFNNYIDWPKEKINNGTGYFNIGILGNSDIYKALKRLYVDKKINDKTVKISIINSLKNISRFDIIYISKFNEKLIRKLVEIADKNNILLIGNTEKLGYYGVHINFYIKDMKLRFTINKESMRKSGIKASSFLLSLAKIVKTKK